jgi:membrane fusion protein (multidrug efflux system)
LLNAYNEYVQGNSVTLLKQHPIFLVFFLVFLGVAGWTVKTYMDNQKVSGGYPRGGETIVVTQPAKMITFVDDVESIGTTRANESISITSKVTDLVQKVNFDDGMYATAGQILVELTNSEETAQLAEAQAAVDESTRQFDRMKNMIDQRLASETQLDIEQARMQTAQARFEAIVARLDERLIRAPFSGVLGFRQVSPGSLLTINTVVTTLDDISVIKLDFSVPENFLSALKPGMEINAKSGAYENEVFVGRVETINSRVDPVTRTVTVRALLKNDDRRLRPGMLLTVSLIRSRKEVLAVPEESVIPVQAKQYVYVVADGVANRVEITTGRIQPGLIEVLGGISAGQQVVTQGAMKLRPGSKVIIKADQVNVAGKAGQ